jgi:uncharacterized protein (TIGR03083 family)
MTERMDALATSVDRFGGVDPGPDAVAGALASQRSRTLELFRSFDDDEWQARSRCSAWTVHDVVRHLVDVANLDTALMRGEGPRTAGGRVDPRTDPGEWLEASRGQPPSQTVAAFEAAVAVEREAFERRIRDGGDEALPGPYGPLHWASVGAHAFWDAWLHERDVLVPLGRPHDCTLAEDRLAALYALAIASTAPTFFGSRVTLAIELTGAASGVYHIAATPEDVRVDFGGSDATPAMRAELGALIDSLAGRGPDVIEVVDVVDGAVDAVEPLTMLRGFLLPTA